LGQPPPKNQKFKTNKMDLVRVKKITFYLKPLDILAETLFEDITFFDHLLRHVILDMSEPSWQTKTGVCPGPGVRCRSNVTD
jgi:hypothetical protein